MVKRMYALATRSLVVPKSTPRGSTRWAVPLCLGIMLMVACGEGSVLTEEPSPKEVVSAWLDIDLDRPEHYASPRFPIHYTPDVRAVNNQPAGNPITDKGATLGRVLFYDKRLSRNNTVSCASCHQQSNGFTDASVKSIGFDGGLTDKHSMRLGNTVFYEGRAMFWDKRANTLESQAIQPVMDPVEMGFDDAHGGINAAVQKLKGLPYYPPLFQEAFGSPEITSERMRLALAQFIRSMVSTDSRFDRAYARAFNLPPPNGGLQAPFPEFTPQENLGKQLFIQPAGQGGLGCAACHVPPTFALVDNSRSNGLDPGETVIFKSPSLKNVAIGGPFMHDGRFETLEEVVDHYSLGMRFGPALDVRLRTPNGQLPLRMNLSQTQKDALVAFMGTLTDQTLINDPKFSDPFKQ